MDLKAYYGKNVIITTDSDKIFSGLVTDYIFPEDNEDNQESIIIESDSGDVTEFPKDTIKKIIAT